MRAHVTPVGHVKVLREFSGRKKPYQMVLASGSFMKETLDGGLVSVVCLGWVEITLPVSHRSQAPFLVARASPRFKNSALHHQGSDVEGGTLWRQPTGDSNGFGLLVLLHTLNNPKASMIYLFTKTCHMQLLLVPGRLVVGGQADQVRTVIGEER